MAYCSSSPRRVAASRVIGDVGIHARVGPGLWREVCARLGAASHAGRYTQGVVAAIDLLTRTPRGAAGSTPLGAGFVATA